MLCGAGCGGSGGGLEIRWTCGYPFVFFRFDEFRQVRQSATVEQTGVGTGGRTSGGLLRGTRWRDLHVKIFLVELVVAARLAYCERCALDRLRGPMPELGRRTEDEFSNYCIRWRLLWSCLFPEERALVHCPPK